MPKKLHDKLAREAKKKFPGNKERQNAYVFGTLQNIEDKKSGKGRHSNNN